MRKNGFRKSLTAVVLLALISFRGFFSSPVTGSVNPSDAALRAWVFSQTDTFNAPVNRGYFIIEGVKPGNYILMLEGKPPYRNTVKEGILVSEGQPTDVGVVEMNK